MDEFEEARNLLEKIELFEIEFKQHFYLKSQERPISESIVREYLHNPAALIDAERQSDGRLRLRFHLSSKYDLVVVIKKVEKILYILTAWNTSRKWQRELRK